MRKIVIITVMLLVVPLVAFATPVPDTGQTKCYDATQEITCPSVGEPFYGQDAQYGNHPQSYTKLDANGDDLPFEATEWVMVRDNVTGLIWEVKDPEDDIMDYNNPHDTDNIYTWYDSNPATNGGDPGTSGAGTDTEDFINALNNAQFGGYDDWRMPTVKELSYIVSRDNHSPSINTDYFPNLDYYGPYNWTSTTDAANSTNAWYVFFVDGTAHRGPKYAPHSARAVRGVQVDPSGDFIDNGDGTITDTRTGLMWQEETISSTITWQEKLSYCENLSLGGYDDWRLPDVNELHSLVDYSRYEPAVDPIFTIGSQGLYASSTTVSSSPPGWWWWGVSFNNGDVGGQWKYAGYHMRAVRGPDLDVDGILYLSDNCPDIPNGPALGTCTSGTVGETCNSSGECAPNGFCSMNQEDMDLDGIGDACDDTNMCIGLADYDQDVDANDVTVFLSHFGRSPFNNPCPIDGPAPVAKTGQTLCYDENGVQRDCAGTGEDGEHQSGVAWPNPRFTDNSDGTVTDNLTGLIWLTDANCIATNYPGFDNDGTAGDGRVTWQHALDFVSGINGGTYPNCGAGSTEWRLPNKKELINLTHDGYYNPTLPNTAGTGQWSEGDPFTNVQSYVYWSSATYADGYAYAWGVFMDDGYVSIGVKTNFYYVWPVRGGH